MQAVKLDQDLPGIKKLISFQSIGFTKYLFKNIGLINYW